jgi:hypothetical protein
LRLLLRALQGHCPGFVRRRILAALSEATARAFGCERPSLAGLPPNALLPHYVEFTARQCEAAIAGGADLAGLHEALRVEAYRVAARMRQGLRLAGPGEVMAAARILYRSVGIELTGDASGHITIARCAFSHRYAPAVCRIMSGLDEGLLTGLAGGGSLRFDQRITEGHPRCLARLSASSSRS